MMNSSRKLRRWGAVGGLFVAALFLAGCKTDSQRPFTNLGAAANSTAGTNDSPPAAAVPAVNPTGLTDSTNPAGSPYIFGPGDAVEVVFMDTPTSVPVVLDRIKETTGDITLMENQTFHVAGKTRAEIEKEIHDRYVPDYFRKLTVTFKHQEEKRFYFVNGEVKAPARQIYVSQMTVTKAIASVGGFTDFAKKTAVQLTRADGRKEKPINFNDAQKDPKLDLEVFPGDTIWVPRKGILDW